MHAAERSGPLTRSGVEYAPLGHAPAAHPTRRALNTRYRRDDGNDVAIGHILRPAWRGKVHVLALALAVPAVLALTVFADATPWRRVAVGVYALGLCSMLLISAIYHRWVHGLRARSAWRRADHAAIFAAIAGSATPIVVWAMPGGAGVVLVGAVWTVAVIGAGCKLGRWSHGDRIGTSMYAAASALSAMALPALWVRHGAAAALLVVVGGIVYLVGAAFFARQWPSLRPSVFSYHEVWHVFTAVAAAAHFAAIWILVT